MLSTLIVLLYGGSYLLGASIMCRSFFYPAVFFMRSLCAGASFKWILVAGFFAHSLILFSRITLGADLIIMVPLGLMLHYLQSIMDLIFSHKAFLLWPALLIQYLITRFGLIDGPLESYEFLSSFSTFYICIIYDILTTR